LKLNSLALNIAVEKLTKRLNSKVHKKVVLRKIEKLSPKKLKRK
jgi:hypothetical protein